MQAYQFAEVSCTLNFAAFRLLYFLNCIVFVQCHANSCLQRFLFAAPKQRPSKILASKSTMEVREPWYTVVLDLNGFLVHRSFDKGHISIARPDCGNFLKALLNKANVVIWSCAIRKNVDSMLEVVVGSSGIDLSNVVVMSQSDVTMSTYPRGREKVGKKYMLKELKKVQSGLEHVDLAMTLFIDDSPEKNLLNNEFSAIHPLSWTGDLTDKFLMTTLLPWLENMFSSNLYVPEYVRDNPLGGCLRPSGIRSTALANNIVLGCYKEWNSVMGSFQ